MKTNSAPTTTTTTTSTLNTTLSTTTTLNTAPPPPVPRHHPPTAFCPTQPPLTPAAMGPTWSTRLTRWCHPLWHPHWSLPRGSEADPGSTALLSKPWLPRRPLRRRLTPLLRRRKTMPPPPPLPLELLPRRLPIQPLPLRNPSSLPLVCLSLSLNILPNFVDFGPKLHGVVLFFGAFLGFVL